MTDTPSRAGYVTAAAEAVRQANHISVSRPTTATDAFDVVGALVDLTRRLRGLVAHVDRDVEHAHPEHYFDDQGLDPTHALIAAHDHLDEAFGHLDTVADHLTAAHNDLGHLGRLTPED